MDGTTTRPGDRWRASLEAVKVPEAVLRRSPDAEASLEPERFRWRPEEDARQPVRPSRRRALEALPPGGSVLDVGVGGGASSLGLVPKAGHITGVDRSEGMLESFRASAAAAGVAVRAVQGRWPDVAAEVEPADVAVCHHAMYSVEEIEDFVTALTARARRRVVLELSAHPPTAGLNPLWKAIHGIDRPVRLVADEAEAVLAAMGLAVEREDIVLPPRRREVTPGLVAFARRRLHVEQDRDPEIAEFLRTTEPGEQRVAALWWPGGA
ncbi:MAG TPA: class I SAM-dependent methyltransferase [Acidimicrobiales bacterium]|nr:class I SAM-dependent methyltransferase [Acidimicrobiales bacterium]